MKLKFIFYALLISAAATFCKQKGIVIVPVADLIGEPMRSRHKSQTYDTLPWSCYRSDYEANLRIHQLLFHEIVTIIQEQNEELLIEIPNVYFFNHGSIEKRRHYWTAKKNIIKLDEQLTNKLPSQYLKHQKHNTVFLIKPWYDRKSHITFSVGTRFVIKKQSPKRCAVYYLHPIRKKIETMVIPQEAIYFHKKHSRKDKRKDFVRIIQSWANPPIGPIGYVLGGCSCTGSLKNNAFSLNEKSFGKKRLRFYERPGAPIVKTGLDCSGLVLRAAQIAGLPYHFKNTTTLEDKLRPLEAAEIVENGDLIWMPGHVIIITDIQKNLAVEAHAYDGGYGVIQEKKLSDLFHHVFRYKDLCALHDSGSPISRLDRTGKPYLTYQKFKILKLASLWAHPLDW